MQRREAFLSAATGVVFWGPLGRIAVVCLSLLCLLSASGCGPIEYINQVTRKASSQVQAAKAVKADKHAPYWYTLAIEYLHKAREEAAAADFQSANLFGRRSARAARKARLLAIERARDPQSRPTIPPAGDEIEIVDPTSDEARADESDNPLESDDADDSDDSDDADDAAEDETETP